MQCSPSHLLSVIFVGTNDATFESVRKLADLVGVEITRICANDGRDGVLRITSQGLPEGYVRAGFHPLFTPYFSAQTFILDCKKETEKLLDLLVSVGVTARGKIIGIAGAHGGAGTSSMAACLARVVASCTSASVSILDLNPASAGIELLLSIVGTPGNRWSDLHGRGALLAGRLNDSLPQWHGIRVLSADARGAVPNNIDTATAAIAAMAQVNEWSVLDLPPSSLMKNTPESHLAQWCDYLLVLTRTDSRHLIGTHTLLASLAMSVPVYVAAVGARSKNHCAHIAQTLNVPGVFRVREDSRYHAALDHGVDIGDRARSSYVRDVQAIYAHIETVVGEIK